jgi:hypothetical protein
MGAAIGVFVGYFLGARAGEKGYAELLDAWDTIRSSEEVKDIIGSGLMIAKDLAGKAAEMMSGSSPLVTTLRRVA